MPDEETPKERRQSKTNHDPHHPQDLSIPPIFPSTDRLLIGRHTSLVQQFVLALTLF